MSLVQFFSDDGKKVINWPEQNYQNGVAKNDTTNRRYKRIVRLLKKLRLQMQEQGIPNATLVPSYLIECLVWNVPDVNFALPTYTEILRNVLLHIWRETRAQGEAGGWMEINKLKPLFGPAQPWTREQVNAFSASAWSYVGYS